MAGPSRQPSSTSIRPHLPRDAVGRFDLCLQRHVFLHRTDLVRSGGGGHRRAAPLAQAAGAAMMAGHFAFAAMVKSREKQLPLWSLMLASQWLDVIFVPLFVAGVERMSAAPGTSGYGSGGFVIPYTHSLAGALALSVLLAIPYPDVPGAALIRSTPATKSGTKITSSHWL